MVMESHRFECPLCGNVSDIFRDKETEEAYCPVCQLPARADSAVPLGDLTLERFIEHCRKRIIVLFWTPWEKESQENLEFFNESFRSAQQQDTILITLDISRNPEMARRFGIVRLPTFVIFERSREANRIIDPISRFDMDRIIFGGTV